MIYRHDSLQQHVSSNNFLETNKGHHFGYRVVNVFWVQIISMTFRLCTSEWFRTQTRSCCIFHKCMFFFGCLIAYRFAMDETGLRQQVILGSWIKGVLGLLPQTKSLQLFLGFPKTSLSTNSCYVGLIYPGWIRYQACLHPMFCRLFEKNATVDVSQWHPVTIGPWPKKIRLVSWCRDIEVSKAL